jgi:hypothetical protein
VTKPFEATEFCPHPQPLETRYLHIRCSATMRSWRRKCASGRELDQAQLEILERLALAVEYETTSPDSTRSAWSARVCARAGQDEDGAT